MFPLCALLLAACAAPAGETSGRSPASAAISLAGERVLVLPVQTGPEVPDEQRSRADTELLFALRERDSRIEWIAPAELKQALERSPAYAADPDRLPADPLVHHGERRTVDPLAGELRRYAALMDVRLVLLPRELIFMDEPGGGRWWIGAALLDSRTADVIWWGGGDGDPSRASDQGALASAAAALARRLIADPPQGGTR